MRHSRTIAVGPATFRVGSVWRAPIAALDELYRDYPAPGGVADFTVRLEPTRTWRRWVRPSVAIGGDHVLPEAAPLPPAQGLLAAEMGMDLQMALGWRRHLLLHAAVVERDGRALVLSGASGSGKSTLAARLTARGWHLLGDESALVDPASGHLHPFPRSISCWWRGRSPIRPAAQSSTSGGGRRCSPRRAPNCCWGRWPGVSTGCRYRRRWLPSWPTRAPRRRRDGGAPCGKPRWRGVPWRRSAARWCC